MERPHSSRTEPGPAVDELSSGIQVPGVTSRLLVHVQNDPPQVGDLVIDATVFDLIGVDALRRGIQSGDGEYRVATS
jgi:hypothetical protein